MVGSCVFEGSFSESFPHLSIDYVGDCWNSEYNNWDLGFRRVTKDNEFDSLMRNISMIDTIRLWDRIDKAYWSLENSGAFSAHSTFHKLTQTSYKLKTLLIKWILKFSIPKKIKVFLWNLTHYSLNTHEWIQRKLRKHCMSPLVCLLCLKG